MPYARQYSVLEVRDLLRASEGANSPVTNAAAHPISRHGQGRADMTTRPGLAQDTAFQQSGAGLAARPMGGHSDQAMAVAQALNSSAGQLELDKLDLGTQQRVRIRAGVSWGHMSSPQARVAHHGAAAAPMSVDEMVVIVDANAATGEPHIQTAYVA